MRLLLWLLLSCICGNSWASVELQFQSVAPKNESDHRYIVYTQLSVGTPPQNVSVRLYLDYTQQNPVFVDNNACKSGEFDPKNSTTFVWDGVEHDGGKAIYYGNDTITLNGTSAQPDVPLIILKDQQNCWDSSSVMGFSFGNNGNYSFVYDFLMRNKITAAILAFKEVGSDPTQPTSGTLSFSESGYNACKPDWKWANLVPQSTADWLVIVDKINVGKFSKANVGFLAFTITGNHEFQIPKNVYTNVARILEVDEDNKIYCDTFEKFELHTTQLVLNIEPEVYMDLSTQDENGKCESRMVESEDTFVLPVSVFRNKCLMLSYQPRALGIASIYQ